MATIRILRTYTNTVTQFNSAQAVVDYFINRPRHKLSDHLFIKSDESGDRLITLTSYEYDDVLNQLLS